MTYEVKVTVRPYNNTNTDNGLFGSAAKSWIDTANKM